MSTVQNILNGQYYRICWELFAARLESFAVPQNNAYKTIRNPDRMDYVTISPEAIKAVKEASEAGMEL